MPLEGMSQFGEPNPPPLVLPRPDTQAVNAPRPDIESRRERTLKKFARLATKLTDEELEEVLFYAQALVDVRHLYVPKSEDEC